MENDFLQCGSIRTKTWSIPIGRVLLRGKSSEQAGSRRPKRRLDTIMAPPSNQLHCESKGVWGSTAWQTTQPLPPQKPNGRNHHNFHQTTILSKQINDKTFQSHNTKGRHFVLKSVCTLFSDKKKKHSVTDRDVGCGGDKIGHFKKWWGPVSSVPSVNDTYAQHQAQLDSRSHSCQI